MRRRLVSIATVALAFIAVFAPPANAQRVLGVGDDALVLPRGVFRLRLIGNWTGFNERYGMDTPGRPNGAASGFLSGMIREPLAGLKGACPVPRETPVALASPATTVDGIVRAAEATDEEWGPLTGMNLPSLRTSVGDMADALERVGGKAASALLDWTPDPAVQKLVKTWPGNVASTRAGRLGLLPDKDFETVIRDYIRENPGAVKLTVR